MNEMAGSPVVLVRWPADADELGRLRTRGIPRLLLVDSDEAAPVDEDPHQDWIRLPADERDLWARVRSLELRSGSDGPKPELSGDGRLHYRGHWVVVSPIAECLAAALVEQFGSVVTKNDLQKAGWPDGTGSSGALRIHVIKLRRLLERLGLELVLVRDRGYVLQPRTSGAAAPVSASSSPRPTGPRWEADTEVLAGPPSRA